MKNCLYIFLQCSLCMLLLALCLTVNYRKASQVSQAGTFGFTEKSNDTFTHLAYMLYKE